MTVRMYINGWRMVAVTTQGRKWLTLLDLGTLRKVKLPTEALRHAKPADYRPKWLARRLDTRRKLFKRNKMPHAVMLVKKTVADLRKEGG